MSNIAKILTGIAVALAEDGPAAVGIEIETALKAMGARESDYFQEGIAMAVFGSRIPEMEEPKDAE